MGANYLYHVHFVFLRSDTRCANSSSKNLTMKLLLIFAVLFFSATAVNAQSNNNNTNRTYYPVPQKGYYAIGNNAKKLAPQGTLVDGTAQVNKGFYAIGDNKKKVVRSRDDYRQQQPAVTKGYYGIGNNAKKL